MTTQQTIITALVAARELISDKKRWTQCAYARNKYRKSCNPSNRSAVKFCGLGALIREVTPDRYAEAKHFLNLAAKQIQTEDGLPGRGTTAIQINDDRGHVAVLRMYDRAIEIAEGGTK